MTISKTIILNIYIERERKSELFGQIYSDFSKCLYFLI